MEGMCGCYLRIVIVASQTAPSTAGEEYIEKGKEEKTDRKEREEERSLTPVRPC